MPGVITSGSLAQALLPGAQTIYGMAYKEYPVEYTDLYDERKSGRAWEPGFSVTSLGLAPERPSGAGTSYSTVNQIFPHRAVHVEHALGYIITRNMVEDDQHNVVMNIKSRALAFSIRQTKEVLGARVFDRGFDSNYVFGDGKELFSDVHPLANGGTWSNELASDLNNDAIEQAIIEISNWTDASGMRISLMSKSLHVGRNLIFDQIRVTQSEKQPGVFLNDINAVKAAALFPGGIKPNHYFEDPDFWAIRTNCPDGMIYFNRRADSFDAENDWDTKNAKFQGDFRCSFTCFDPRGVFGSTPG